jgi:hypothetical protein
VKIDFKMYLKDSVLDSGEGPRARAGARVLAGSVNGLGEDGALGNNDDVSSTEGR